VRVIGSFALIPLANLGVVTTVLERDAFDIVNRIQILNLSLLGAVLSLTILGVFYYSQSLSKPLKELALATRQIKAGNYEITIEPKTKDEVGQLTRNFMSMIPP
jgi:adenylate cyclase